MGCFDVVQTGNTMNISKNEQRVLHALAQGGFVQYDRAANGKITDITCFTREGYVLSNCTMDVFTKLRRKGLVASRKSGAYRISDRGRRTVGAHLAHR
jgi:uncharacterized protein YjhX (UPF0386 family)